MNKFYNLYKLNLFALHLSVCIFFCLHENCQEFIEIYNQPSMRAKVIGLVGKQQQNQ